MELRCRSVVPMPPFEYIDYQTCPDMSGPLFALKIVPSRVAIWTPCNTQFLELI